MKALKSTIQANRSLASLLLVFVFLYAGLVRNSVRNLSLDTNSEFVYKKANSKAGVEITQSDDGAAQGLVNQFKKVDNDLDDAEVAPNFGLSLTNPIALYQSHDFFRCDVFRSLSKLPLYDLFCNWKFHLL